MFGTSDVPASIISGAPVCYANQVVNPRTAEDAEPDIPKTGDGSLLWLWTGMIALSCAGLFALRKRRA